MYGIRSYITTCHSAIYRLFAEHYKNDYEV